MQLHERIAATCKFNAGWRWQRKMPMDSRDIFGSAHTCGKIGPMALIMDGMRVFQALSTPAGARRVRLALAAGRIRARSGHKKRSDLSPQACTEESLCCAPRNCPIFPGARRLSGPGRGHRTECRRGHSYLRGMRIRKAGRTDSTLWQPSRGGSMWPGLPR